MDTQLLAGLAAFALVTSLTPGPNNLMLMTSGVNYGVRRSLPHLIGVSGGFTLMVLLVGVGLVGVVERVPLLHVMLKIASVAYLLYLAGRIATAEPSSAEVGRGRPFTFMQAALFQWVNPKAWAMALTAVTVYTVSHDWLEILVVAALFGAINLPSCASWVALGHGLRRWLHAPGRLRIFNLTMAGLLVLSLYPVLFG